MWNAFYPFSNPVTGAIAAATYAYVFGSDMQKAARIGFAVGTGWVLVSSVARSRTELFDAPVVEEVVSAPNGGATLNLPALPPVPTLPVPDITTAAGSRSSARRYTHMGCPQCGGGCADPGGANMGYTVYTRRRA